MKEPLRFICTQCGSCCHKAGRIPNFPEPTTPEGVCVHLTSDNKCSIYDKRPTICRVDKLYETMGRAMHMTRKQFYIYNNQLCNQWIREEKLGDHFLINMVDYIRMNEE